MIGYLSGKILEQAEGKILVGVGNSTEAGMVGYALSVPQGASYDGFAIGKNAELFVYTHVREDALDLYGFATRLEKELFLTLLTVTGIGPKGALGILSKVAPNQLIQAILEKDKETLTKIPGIGKKTAERVVLELADPIRKKVEAGTLSNNRSLQRGSSSTGARTVPSEGMVVRDAKAALIGLGYREQDVSNLIERLWAESEEQPQRTEDLIRIALRRLSMTQ